MRNTRFDQFFSRQVPREQQAERLRKMIREELTSMQRQTLVAYYFEGKTLTQIARLRQVNKSTVCRTLKRAENKLLRMLRY